MRIFQVGLLSLLLFGLAISSVAQQTSSAPEPAEAFCGFDDGSTIKVQYSTAAKNDFHDGKIWEPGGSPLILFTQATLTIGGTEIPSGAYSMYVLPRKQHWTLIVNKNVVAKNKYDEKLDLVRVPMESTTVETPFKRLEVAFAHVAPKECNLRIYYERTGAWAEFHEK
jgi:hypothetical protein